MKRAEQLVEPWRTLQWNGMTLLRCRQCAWDTLDGEAAMRAHLVRHANADPERPQRARKRRSGG
jgi:hypothetical protein